MRQRRCVLAVEDEVEGGGGLCATRRRDCRGHEGGDDRHTGHGDEMISDFGRLLPYDIRRIVSSHAPPI